VSVFTLQRNQKQGRLAAIPIASPSFAIMS
jgi:hypothetical protein